MEAKTTPGPWEWRDMGDATVLWGAHGDRPIVLDCIRAGMQGAKFRLRCNGIMRNVSATSLNHHPDGQLILAAPDLLAACKAVRRALIAYRNDEGLEVLKTNPLESLLNAAIAKAESP